MVSIVYSKFNHYNFVYYYRTNGKEIFVPLDENYTEAKNIREGAVITLKHSGYNVYGKLQQPKFYRERTDVPWEELIKT